MVQSTVYTGQKLHLVPPMPPGYAAGVRRPAGPEGAAAPEVMWSLPLGERPSHRVTEARRGRGGTYGSRGSEC